MCSPPKLKSTWKKLPQLEAYDVGSTHDWIDLLEKGGYLVNVPQDVIDFWRGPLRSYVGESDVTTAIKAYNTVDAKSLAEIKTEFLLRGGPLLEDYYQVLLSFYRDYEQTGEAWRIDHINYYKEALAFLNSLTDEQWGHLTDEDIEIFTDPSQGYDLESFKQVVGLYVPLIDVPTPIADFAKFYVFPNFFNDTTWPILLIVDNDKGGWEVQDEQYSHAKLQLKFVADDGTETILRDTEFGTNGYYNIERDMLYIPPKSGRLWYRYVDFCVAANSDVRRDGDWAGGIAITHGYIINGGRDDAKEIYIGNNPSPTIPMEAMGVADWDIDAYFVQKEREYQEDQIRFQKLVDEINPLRRKMGAQLYPEDFYTEGLTNRDQSSHMLDPAHAPQWAIDGQAALKKFFSGPGEFTTVMYGVRNDVEANRGYKLSTLMQMRSMSAPKPEHEQKWHDLYDEWLASEVERKARVAKRRAEIVEKRAGRIEETSFEWEMRLNSALAAAKRADNRAEIDRLKAEIAAGYTPVATNQQQPQNQQQGTPPAQNQQQGGQQVQGGQVVQETPQEKSAYTKSKAFINRLKKALKSENLFQAGEFGKLEQAIKDGDMAQAFAKLDGYKKTGRQKG